MCLALAPSEDLSHGMLRIVHPLDPQYITSKKIISLFKWRPQINLNWNEVHFTHILPWAGTLPSPAPHHQCPWQTPALLHPHHRGLWRRTCCTARVWARNLLLVMICAAQGWGWSTRTLWIKPKVESTSLGFLCPFQNCWRYQHDSASAQTAVWFRN